MSRFRNIDSGGPRGSANIDCNLCFDAFSSCDCSGSGECTNENQLCHSSWTQRVLQDQGSGRPLVLLHGALSNIDTDFGKLLPELAKKRQVIMIEQQAHGHTADIDRPLTYELMADDTAELLSQLKIEKADFFGYRAWVV